MVTFLNDKTDSSVKVWTYERGFVGKQTKGMRFKHYVICACNQNKSSVNILGQDSFSENCFIIGVIRTWLYENVRDFFTSF